MSAPLPPSILVELGAFRRVHGAPFTDALRPRLEQGHAEYGDRSIHRPLPELVDEIRQEFLDVAGWSLIVAAGHREIVTGSLAWEAANGGRPQLSRVLEASVSSSAHHWARLGEAHVR